MGVGNSSLNYIQTHSPSQLAWSEDWQSLVLFWGTLNLREWTMQEWTMQEWAI